MKKKIYYLFMVVGVSLLAFACSENSDDDAPELSKNIVQTAQDTDALSVLVQALAKADELGDSDLIGTLSGNGPFTVFAPTNDAFTALLGALDNYNSLDDFDTDEDKMLLASILQYHVIAGAAAKSTDLSDGQVLATVQQETLTVKIDNGVFISDATDTDATVVIADVIANNGVVHVIDKVLLPQAVLDAINDGGMGTLVDIVVATEALSVLEAAVIKANLAVTLSSEGPFTVFAPTDDAFVALLDALGDDYNSLDDFDTEGEIALLKDILLYHVVAGSTVLSTDLAEGEVATALADNNIEVIAEAGTFVIGDASDVNANITGVDIMASNGVAHTIDKVLLPQAAIDAFNIETMGTLVDIVVETEALSLLEAAVIKADLVATLSSEGPFTVFAPTDDAFVALLEVLGDDYTSLDDFDTEGEIALLKDILLYHVVAGSTVLSTDLAEGEVATALADNNIEVIADGGTFVIGDASEINANITADDIMASNGVAHTIDKVLLPQAAIDFVASLDH